MGNNWRHTFLCGSRVIGGTLLCGKRRQEKKDNVGRGGIPKEMEMSVDTVPPTFCDLVGVLVRRMRLQWWVAGG